jgi:hypothetical protein
MALSKQADLVRHASRRFGKGRHPAGLNYEDCCSLALYQSTGEPLLFKGRAATSRDRCGGRHTVVAGISDYARSASRKRATVSCTSDTSMISFL